MIHLTEEMRDHIDNALANMTPCILATASPDGAANVGFRGSMMVFDEETLAFWDRGKGSSLGYVEDNPKVMALFRNHATQVAWKFRCVATVHRDGPIREQVMARVVAPELERDPDRTGIAVLLRVDQVLTLAGEVLQERSPDSHQ